MSLIDDRIVGSERDPIANFGRAAAAKLMAKMNAMPPNLRKETLRVALNDIDMNLWNEVDVKTRRLMDLKGYPASMALRKALEASFANKLLNQFKIAGVIDKVPRSPLGAVPDLKAGSVNVTAPSAPTSYGKSAALKTNQLKLDKTPQQTTDQGYWKQLSTGKYVWIPSTDPSKLQAPLPEPGAPPPVAPPPAADPNYERRPSTQQFYPTADGGLTTDPGQAAGPPVAQTSSGMGMLPILLGAGVLAFLAFRK